MEHLVYKELHTQPQKVADILRTADPGSRILIVFWHGLGDTLMYMPLHEHLQRCFPRLHFDLGLLPGVGQAEFLGHRSPPESEFLSGFDATFVLSFPMVEGSSTMTKVEYCCKTELGLDLPPNGFGLPYVPPVLNRLVGLHLQGTCLPGSTNPDEQTAKIIWNDLVCAGFVPIDLHFIHPFHNPANAPYSWTARNCRDLQPDLRNLRMMIDRCAAVIAVASGPFVLSAAINSYRTIYLQKHHPVGCYMRGFTNVIDLQALSDFTSAERSRQERIKLTTMVRRIVEGA